MTQSPSAARTHNMALLSPTSNDPYDPQSPDLMMSGIGGPGGDFPMHTGSMASAASPTATRKDPNKEFFQMCLLSYKLNNQ